MPELYGENQKVNPTDMEVTPFHSEYLWQNDSFYNLGNDDNCGQYRFKRPGSEIKDVRQIVDLYHCDLKTVDNISEYPVTAKEDAQTTKILGNTVMNALFSMSSRT
jgi:hypothetical protein